jgi:lysylphosphatidylglycerol synthetase-like protein (DUF2156 family)
LHRLKASLDGRRRQQRARVEQEIVAVNSRTAILAKLDQVADAWNE